MFKKLTLFFATISIFGSMMGTPNELGPISQQCHKTLNELIDAARSAYQKRNDSELIRLRNTYAALKYTISELTSDVTPGLERATLESLISLFGGSFDIDCSDEELMREIISTLKIWAHNEHTSLNAPLLTSRTLMKGAYYTAGAALVAATLYAGYKGYSHLQENSYSLTSAYEDLKKRCITPLYNLFHYLVHINDIEAAEKAYGDHLRRYIQDNHANSWHYFQPGELRNLPPEELQQQIEHIIRLDVNGESGSFLTNQIAVQGNNWLRNIALGSFGSTMLVFAHKNYLNFLKMENSLKLLFATTTVSVLSVFTYYSLQSAKSMYSSYRQHSKILIKIAAHELFILYNEMLDSSDSQAWQQGLAAYYSEHLEELAAYLPAHERHLLAEDCHILHNKNRPLAEKIRLIAHWHTAFNLAAA